MEPNNHYQNYMQMMHNLYFSSSPSSQNSSSTPNIGATFGMLGIQSPTSVAHELHPATSPNIHVQNQSTPTNSQIPPFQESQLPPFSTQLPLDNVIEITDEDSLLNKSETRVANKWSVVEDTILISGWLNTSKDPIISNNQKMDSFWKRITNYYNDNSKNSQPREAKFLKARWFRLQKSVNKFIGCYKRCIDRRQSGASESDVLKSAHMLYTDENGGKFSWEYAWDMLKNEPKFLAQVDGDSPNASKRTKVFASGEYTSSSDRNIPLCDESNPMLSPSGRPIGRDVAKRKERRNCTSSPSAPPMNAQLKDMLNVVTEKVDKKHTVLQEMLTANMQYALANSEAAFAQARASDHDILMKDTSSMTEEQLKDHNLMREFIRAKYRM